MGAREGERERIERSVSVATTKEGSEEEAKDCSVWMATTGDLSACEKQTTQPTRSGARDGLGFGVIYAHNPCVVSDNQEIIEKGIAAVVLCVAGNKQE